MKESQVMDGYRFHDVILCAIYKFIAAEMDNHEKLITDWI